MGMLMSVSNLDEYRSGTTKEVRTGLKSSGGGGTFTGGSGGGASGDMEAVWKKFEDQDNRFDKIEGKLDKLLESMNDVRVDLARVEGRVNSLPSTWQMITLVFGILGGAFLIVRFGLSHLGG